MSTRPLTLNELMEHMFDLVSRGYGDAFVSDQYGTAVASIYEEEGDVVLNMNGWA